MDSATAGALLSLYDYGIVQKAVAAVKKADAEKFVKSSIVDICKKSVSGLFLCIF